MHDLYFAKQVLDQILQYASQYNIKKITRVVVEIGKIKEHDKYINSSNFKFNFSSLARNTVAAKAKIIIRKTFKPNYLRIIEIKGEKQ